MNPARRASLRRRFPSSSTSRIHLTGRLFLVVIQAAFTRGCLSKGLEVVKGRHEYAITCMNHALSCIEEDKMGEKKFPTALAPGEMVFYSVDLRSPACKDVFLKPSHEKGAIKAFFNNFNGILGDLSSDATTGTSVESYVAGQFASWPPGSQLVTVSPLLCLGKSNKDAVWELQKFGLSAGSPSDASFFSVTETFLGPQNKVMSWSCTGTCVNTITAYKYTRLSQNSHGSAVFLCLNPDCGSAQAGTPVDAVKMESGLPLVNRCSCRKETKNLRPRKRAEH